MMIRVRMFAAARELAEAGEVAVEVADGATLAAVQQALLAAVPALDRVLPHARWAIDEEFADEDAVVTEKSQVALIPPVSGG